MTKLPLAWSKGLNQKDMEALEYVLRNNTILIPKLLEVISEFEAEENRSETTLSDYDSPSWSHKQADRNGARRAYKRIKSLFSYMNEVQS
jgi:hypothetical protein